MSVTDYICLTNNPSITLIYDTLYIFFISSHARQALAKIEQTMQSASPNNSIILSLRHDNKSHWNNDIATDI